MRSFIRYSAKSFPKQNEREMIISSHQMLPQGLAATMETPLFSRLKRRSLPPPPQPSTSNGAAIYDYPFLWDRIHLDNASDTSQDEGWVDPRFNWLVSEGMKSHWSGNWIGAGDSAIISVLGLSSETLTLTLPGICSYHRSLNLYEIIQTLVWSASVYGYYKL